MVLLDVFLILRNWEEDLFMDMRQRIADLAGEMLRAAFPEAQGLPEDLAALLEVPPV